MLNICLVFWKSGPHYAYKYYSCKKACNWYSLELATYFDSLEGKSNIKITHNHFNQNETSLFCIESDLSISKR